MNVDKEKLRRVQDALKGIQKTLGKDSVGFLKDFGEDVDVEFVSTGLLSLDLAIRRGLPKGSFVELAGKPSSGKTTLSLGIMGQVLSAGGIVLYIDAEHSFDPEWAELHGVSRDDPKLLISQPSTLEEGLDVADGLIKSAGVDLVVIDSLASLTPEAILKGKMGDETMGLRARRVGQFIDKVKHYVYESGCIVLVINQFRESLNPYQAAETPGGWALKHHARVRMRVNRKQDLKIEEEHIGIKSQVLITKNKVGTPYQRCDFNIYYDSGLSYEYDVFEHAVNLGIIKKSGTWYSYEGDSIGQGERNVLGLLRAKPDFFNEIKGKVLETYGIS